MNTKPKPMLANKDIDLAKIAFPVYVQPKLDGVRALITREGVMGRSGKLIRNKAVQKEFWRPELIGLDGELIAGDATASASCRLTTGILNSPDDKTQVSLVVYDLWEFEVRGPRTFADRYGQLERTANTQFRGKHIELCPTLLVDDLTFLHIWEHKWVGMGYEGLIGRSPGAAYVHGRSGKKDQALWALKRFEDTEAQVIGFNEEMHNANERKEDAWGRGERSSAKAGLIGKGTLGALVCESEKWTDTFEIGTGFTAQERQDLWREREALKGRVVKFKFFPHGTLDRPRHPVFLAFRLPEDIS